LIASSPANAGEAFGLTPLGQAQVRRSLKQARESGKLESPILLISSPLLRARESAGVAADVLGVSMTIDARLSERGFGDLELEPDNRYEEVWAADRLDATHRSWGIESVADVLKRVGPVVDELTRDESFATVILCTHGDVASTLLCASLGVPLEEHREVGGPETGALHELGTRVG
jgi:probable phosphoglycerate mutase